MSREGAPRYGRSRSSQLLLTRLRNIPEGCETNHAVTEQHIKGLEDGEVPLWIRLFYAVQRRLYGQVLEHRTG